MPEMDFEVMLRQFFGDKAFHTAGLAYSKTPRNKWLKKLERKILKDIDQLDTLEKHKSLMMCDTERLFLELKVDEPSWESMFAALMLISRLLGYDYCKGSKLHTPAYYQTEGQFYTQAIFGGGDEMQNYYDRKDIISMRAKVAKRLIKAGLDTFRISQILNISEGKVKQLLKN